LGDLGDRSAEDIRPKNVARDARYSFHCDGSIRWNLGPLRKSARRYLELFCQGGAATAFLIKPCAKLFHREFY